MMIFIVLFVMGLILGFVGAGGAGVVIAVLTVVFDVPIHTALGTSLSAMIFTTLSGAYSHFREGNVVVKTGAAVGIFGAVGSFTGTRIATLLPAGHLTWLTAGMLFLSALLIAMRVFFPFFSRGIFARTDSEAVPGRLRFWGIAGGLGIVTGFLSGTFGIGSTPFIQIGLLFFFGMSLTQSAGTTMLVILPIALLGGIGYLTAGYLDVTLLIHVTAGLMSGAYIGAKFTKRLDPRVLKIAMVAVPVIGGLLLLIGS
jgi:uncharacterized membrane protein YfcA